MKNRVLSKNSQSSIVTTVLIIIIGLVAVAILAAFIINQVRNSANDAEIRTKLSQMSFETKDALGGTNYLFLQKSFKDNDLSIKNISVLVNGKSIRVKTDELENWASLESKEIILDLGGLALNKGDIIQIFVIPAGVSRAIPVEVAKYTVVKDSLVKNILPLFKSLGDSCVNNTECLSNLCFDSICKIATGQGCTQDSDCALGPCRDSLCKSDLAQSCNSDSECVSNICGWDRNPPNNPVCTDGNIGNLCVTDADCSSSACGTYSLCGGKGASCSPENNGLDCLSNYCSTDLGNICAEFGCTDYWACNYDSNADIDDGSCDYSCWPGGCTDWNACNYDSNAQWDDGSCDYYSCHYGCTDSNACNYDSSAWWSDSSCYYDCRYGCTDSNACNYNPDAWWHNYNCDYYSCHTGCTEPGACNYNPDAWYNDGSCEYSSCME